MMCVNDLGMRRSICQTCTKRHDTTKTGSFDLEIASPGPAPGLLIEVGHFSTPPGYATKYIS